MRRIFSVIEVSCGDTAFTASVSSRQEVLVFASEAARNPLYYFRMSFINSVNNIVILNVSGHGTLTL